MINPLKEMKVHKQETEHTPLKFEETSPTGETAKLSIIPYPKITGNTSRKARELTEIR